MTKTIQFITIFLLVTLTASPCARAATKPVRVVILDGQSNMEGAARDQSPSGQGYHWNSNAETYDLIGEAMGEAMKRLLGPK